jgi:transcriptional regulator GlxA family with amidase domain
MAHKMRLRPDYSFSNAPFFDILVIPGGLGAREREFHNNKVIEWIANRMKIVQLMKSVCTGALLLAKTGLGKNATTYWASYDRLQNDLPEVKVQKYVKFVDEENIITSGRISAGFNMALHIV